MPKTLPEIGSKVRTNSEHDTEVTMLGPSSCGTDGRIGVQREDGSIDLLHHVDDLLPGAIGWTD